jgi:nicotinamidase-related amidase
MTRYTDRPNTALLVIDVQKGVVEPSPNREEMIANISTLLDRARAASAPVVWVQHSGAGLEQGSPQWEYVDELSRRDSEPLVHKKYGDSFADTDLEQHLEDLGVGRLVVAGAQTDMCIRSTLHGALARGYDATLVGDAHGTEDMREWGAPMGPMEAVAYTNLYWSESRTHEAAGDVKPTAEVTFAQSRDV